MARARAIVDARRRRSRVCPLVSRRDPGRVEAINGRRPGIIAFSRPVVLRKVRIRSALPNQTVKPITPSRDRPRWTWTRPTSLSISWARLVAFKNSARTTSGDPRRRYHLSIRSPSRPEPGYSRTKERARLRIAHSRLFGGGVSLRCGGLAWRPVVIGPNRGLLTVCGRRIVGRC
jgi:hypothetical protein